MYTHIKLNYFARTQIKNMRVYKTVRANCNFFTYMRLYEKKQQFAFFFKEVLKFHFISLEIYAKIRNILAFYFKHMSYIFFKLKRSNRKTFN